MDVNYDISLEAELELNKALCYFKLYDKENDFMDDLLDQLRIVSAMPEAFQIRYKKVRIVSLENYNYSIHYAVYKNSVIVLRIINQNQDF